MMPEISTTVKIGMVAPSRAGKTSLMTAVFQAMQNKLRGNDQNIFYTAKDETTMMRIKSAISHYSAVTDAAENIFDVPEVKPNQESFCYQFATTIGAGRERQCLYFDILDYPGGFLGMPEFASEIMPHLNESMALIVPIPADLLMEWKMNHGKNNSAAIKKTEIAKNMLYDQETRNTICDWAERRARSKNYSILIFVPVKCEAYFDDNGGRRDESVRLHEAVEDLYIKQVQPDLSDAARERLQIETLAVDTYGTVELLHVILAENKLVSTFRKRLHAGNNFRIKGAFELLSTIIRFKLQERAAAMKLNEEELRRQISERGFFKNIWYAIFPDPEHQKLINEMQQKEATWKAMVLINDLDDTLPKRRKVHNQVVW